MVTERSSLTGWRWRGPTAVLLLALLIAPGATLALTNADNPFRASPSIMVYHSRDGDGYYDFTRVLPLGTQTLDIWATGGAISSVPGPTLCLPGSPSGGQEVCALNIHFQLSGNGELISFAAADGLSSGSFVNPPGTLLTVNLTSGAAPLPAGFPPMRIGALTLAVNGGDVVVNMTGVQGLGPDQAPHPMEPHTMFLPEPGQFWLLSSALLGLAALHRVRKARAR
jgi:hypothetical protein